MKPKKRISAFLTIILGGFCRAAFVTVDGRPEDFCLKGRVGRSKEGEPILHNSAFCLLRKEI